MEEFGRKNGYELSRCEFVKEAGTWYLRVYVDRLTEDGYGWMTSDDCEIVSRYLSDRLDEEDPISQNYYLEVSSPGLDRPLISRKDFDRFTGSRVEIKLYEALDGKKHLEGELLGLKDGTVTIKDDDGKEISLPKEKAAKINLAVVF
ncbi:MAG: ribosome maturation factor RimP [Firmicutes bacterium]|nr:ribosome maturation factor RimP [Bacillota bacterium]